MPTVCRKMSSHRPKTGLTLKHPLSLSRFYHSRDQNTPIQADKHNEPII